MRQLVALLLFAGSSFGAAVAMPAWADDDPTSIQLTARPTFDLQAARRLLLAQASDQPDDASPSSADDDLSDEDFEEFLNGSPAVGDNDPLESINRPIFAFNLALDRWVLRPVTRVYIETVPEPGRSGIANVLDNVKSPVVFANDLLQGELSRAGATFGRFFINTIFGLGGLFDTAEALGLPGHDEDFGQTLGSYGVGGSPYLVLPLLGPSNPRDAVGTLVDTGIDPLTYIAPIELRGARTGVSLVSDRASILNETEALEETSIDFYAAVRSFYYQNRDFEISNEGDDTIQVGGRLPSLATSETAADVDLYGDLKTESGIE